jgi:hypothetical protein
LAAPPDRKLDTVEKCSWEIPERLRVSVREVCIDMREGYASAVKKVLPQSSRRRPVSRGEELFQRLYLDLEGYRLLGM